MGTRLSLAPALTEKIQRFFEIESQRVLLVSILGLFGCWFVWVLGLFAGF